jgi:ABC-type arginine/histidine transport system permease subunit
MGAKQKARELLDKFSNECLLTRSGGKIAALIAVDEILNAVTTIADKKYDYWQEVKKYISYE